MAEERKGCYLKDADGYLHATLYLTDTERAQRADAAMITDTPPPQRPAPVFDELALHKNALRRLLEQTRQKLVRRPITYDGALFDGDDAAQKAVSDKVGELNDMTQLGQTMAPDKLVWRDANNVDHTFADQATYASWMKGLRVALVQRNTNARMWSWQKKSAIDAAATVTDVRAISVDGSDFTG